MKSVSIALLVVAASVLAGCGRYFTPNINLDRYATKEEIVGTWRLLPSTLQLATRDGYKPSETLVHELEFRADGSCTFESITEWAQKATYLSMQGTWTLEHDTERKGERKRKNELKLTLGSQGLEFYLTEEDGKVLLWYWWGDPDSWEFIKYEKRG
jgi:hypothetical protein